jgi:hypothetical protein
MRGSFYNVDTGEDSIWDLILVGQFQRSEYSLISRFDINNSEI